MNEIYLVKVEAGANNNKYYKMIPNSDGNTFTVQFGRIGAGCQTSSYSMSQWSKKYNEKIKKGYVDNTHLVAEATPNTKSATNKYIEIDNASIAQIVARLQAMARKTIEENYTISSNKVTKAMVETAQVTLNNLISTSSSDNVDKFNELLVELFQIIPRKMGRVKDYLACASKDFARILETEQDLLDVMRGQVVTHTVEDISSDDMTDNAKNQTILEAMGLVFEIISGEEEKMIKNKLGNISNRFHQAWKVTNLKTQKNFDKFVAENKIKDCRLLHHGTRSENVWSIINMGLVLRPNAVTTGKLYGHGIYFAPKAEKSLGYTSLSGSYWSKGNSNSGFMALMDVAYGKPYDVYDFDSKYYDLNYKNLQKFCPNSNCLHAHAGANIGHSNLRNDEIVVFDENQCTIKYLIELK